ncbi:hypothetical protein VF21_02345 [Pseudogymnoascus sp. 05NY08]|nr:hypothetical protein VF21_02345 [Pseudogymnoascus sp. 05NY08]
MNRYACEECRHRKFRCSKERPSCAYCRRERRPCVYSAKIQRSPLTREYVTSLENRLQKLEAKCAELIPGVDLEKLAPQTPGIPGSSTWELPTNPWAATTSDAPSHPSYTDSFPRISTGFEWSEQGDALNQLADGMAFLSVNPEGAGYLGTSANVALLRSLHHNGWTIDSSVSRVIDSSRAVKPSLREAWAWSEMTHDADLDQLISTLIDSYFRNFHTRYPIVHEATFRAQTEDLAAKPDPESWLLLRHVILAIGGWCMGYDTKGFDELLGAKTQGWSRNTSILSSGSLTLVQAVALKGHFTQRQNNPNTGWNFSGLAVRIAISLGLHREFPAWNISVFDREMRRRVGWCVFVMDAGTAITFGRPILWPTDGMMDIKEPMNVDDEKLTSTTLVAPEESTGSTIYSHLIWQIQFHQLTNSMYTRRMASFDLPAEEILEMDSKITVWEKTLPAYFKHGHTDPTEPEYITTARCRLLWRLACFRIMLHTPLLLRWATEKSVGVLSPQADTEAARRCRELCLEYAHLTVKYTEEYFSLHIFSPMHDWYAIYYLFQSSLIPVFCITTEPTSPDAAAWGADIEAAKRILETVNTHSDKARRFLDVLNRLYSSLDEMEGFMETMQQEGGDIMGMVYGQMQGAPESAQQTGHSIHPTGF